MAGQDTLAGRIAASGASIIERKVKPDGSVREFACRVLHREPGMVVVRYVVNDGSSFTTPLQLEPGTASDGYFWEGRPYNVYRMRGPDGAIVCHRFDAVADVTIEDGSVSYRDLILDWWLLPDAGLVEEDRDELDAAAAAGQLTPGDLAAAAAATEAVRSGHTAIVAEVAAIEARFGA